jgi:redox-sensitive bicupin YhaK (pirin superfamily)
MIKYIDHTKMGHFDHGWLNTRHHFSFASYYNPDNINFGKLRVLNDDYVEPGYGFEVHPHENMEIISYVIDGELTHGDSMGNKQSISRGQVQYMSAGTGVWHSEHNLGNDLLRFFQIWILPDANGYTPNYGDYRFNFEDRIGKWLPIATSVDNKENDAPIKIHQDMNVYATVVEAGEEISFEVVEGRQAYMVLIEGEADINNLDVHMKDALEITEENVTIKAKEQAHLIVLEMAKENN